MSTPRELLYFALLSRAEQERAIRRLAATGMSDTTIATATKLSVEMVRRILAKNERPA
jgi:DNA invertase Pin-like site-specific DNA recombinase